MLLSPLRPAPRRGTLGEARPHGSSPGDEPWPVFDPAKLGSGTTSKSFFRSTARCGPSKFTVDLDEKDLEALALADENVRRHMEGKTAGEGDRREEQARQPGGADEPGDPLKETLSVVLMTLNEERNIDRCLGSVRWADEIVVVDSFSPDRTVELARRYTATGSTSTNIPGSSRQVERGITYATGDWILVIDADEEVTPRTCRGDPRGSSRCRDGGELSGSIPPQSVEAFGQVDRARRVVPRLPVPVLPEGLLPRSTRRCTAGLQHDREPGTAVRGSAPLHV